MQILLTFTCSICGGKDRYSIPELKKWKLPRPCPYGNETIKKEILDVENKTKLIIPARCEGNLLLVKIEDYEN